MSSKSMFSEMGLVKEPKYPLEDYKAFINLFQKQAQLYYGEVYVRYQDKSSNGEVVVKTLTYGQVDRISSNLACTLQETLGSKSTIALLKDHSVYYLILMIALFKLRIPVLLLSTRNSTEAILALLTQVNADALLYGENYKDKKDVILEAAEKLDGVNILFAESPTLDLDALVRIPLNPHIDTILNLNFTQKDLQKTLLIIHSSGTTSYPKPVYWTNEFQLYHLQSVQHNFIKSNLHKFVEDSNDVLIGITPSYHMFGQYSDFYPILNGSSHYFFLQFPPSAKEVIATIKTERITRLNAPPYYINQLLHYMKETGDIEPFQKMKLIVSGGAAIPKETDKFFMKHKLNFVMLYAMSECCNLMCSDLSEKKIDSNTYFFYKDSEKHAFFEHFDGDRYQLIVRAGSPFRAQRISTRENGDYATKDLFVKSLIAENGYNYVGRTDDTLVMVNGEKTNPLPLEDIIKSNAMVSHCTVIGEARPCSAALIELNFNNIKSQCLDTVLEKVQETVRKANKAAPDHSAILPQMVKFIPFDKHLPTTDKGTVSRKRAIDQFKEDVDDMYSKFLTYKNASNKKRKVDSSSKNSLYDIHSQVVGMVSQVLESKTIQENVSLFKQGLNSLLSIQLRNYLSEELYEVPQDFLYEHPTIEGIVQYFKDISSSIGYEAISYNYQKTTELLQNYLSRASKEISKIDNNTNFNDSKEHQQVVLLTGATGSLGSSILLNLLKNPQVKKVYALVRGQKDTNLLSRISESFRKRGYPESELYNKEKLQVLPMGLEKDDLGLPSIVFKRLRSEVTMVLACAWLLDFNHSLSHYDSECINGLYNLVKFANNSNEERNIYLHFVSSVSATSAYNDHSSVPESSMPANPRIALPMGYAQSKYLVEQLFQYLVEEKNMPCFVHRVGQLCGDSKTGVWNFTEMYPLTIIGGGIFMKKMPNLGTIINWLPVDFAGDAIADIMLKTATKSTPLSFNDAVFHIVNTKEISWESLLEQMKKDGVDFEIVDPESWVKELSQNQGNPAHKLISFYEKLFKNKNKQTRHLEWDTSKTQNQTSAIVNAPTVNDRLAFYLENWKSKGHVIV